METVSAADAGFGPPRHEDSPELSQKALSELDDENKNMAGEPALNTPWTFWFDRAPKGTNAQDYFANLKKICSVNSIKAFWCVFNNLRTVEQLKEGESYHLMRGYDRRPVWEDRDNAEGGRWTFQCKKESTGTAWLELLLAAVGEGFSDHIAEGDRVVGISVKVREHAVFQIWNQSVAARDQSKVMEKVKELLHGASVTLSREKYQSNKANLVHSMMRPSHHKSPAQGPGGGGGAHHHTQFSSPQSWSPRPSLLHTPQTSSVQPFTQPWSQPSAFKPLSPPSSSAATTSIDEIQPASPGGGAGPLEPRPPASPRGGACPPEPRPPASPGGGAGPLEPRPPASPGGGACPPEPRSSTIPPSGERPCSLKPHLSPLLQVQPPFSMTTVQLLPMGGTQPPCLGEVPTGAAPQMEISYLQEVGVPPAPLPGVTTAPSVGVGALLLTPHKFRHPHEGFRYRHPPPLVKRFPSPHGNQTHSLLGPWPGGSAF